MNTNPFYVVAVHGGAGSHSRSKTYTMEVKHALISACESALARLVQNRTALDATESAITVLEDDPSLNAGYGSNLTLEGTVECDAALMDGATGNYGSVGAISGVKNPICAARTVLRHAFISDPLGRIPPLLMVSRGAETFAQNQGLPCVSPELMISPRAQADWERWKTRLDSVCAGIDVPEDNFPRSSGLRDIQDTVGAIAWDPDGGLAAGVSSGGLLLKHSGRIGEAATFGAGCWAHQLASNDVSCSFGGVACSVSGTGEYIMRCVLAKTIGEKLLSGRGEDTHDVLHEVLENFHVVCRSLGDNEAHAGVLLLVKERDEAGTVNARLWCAFTTENMAVGYASSLNPQPKAVIIRRPSQPASVDRHSMYITTLPLTAG
ncbi:unnamed protein product [Somion occarium]|uniref:N-terminal nucleophile aminohydrolase n=1 Tax=Somion occarium TaxID=3059160 RepID=A0ABP1DLT5_9APHY